MAILEIPKQGIKGYMDDQAFLLTPPSAWWKAGQWTSNGFGFYVMIAFGVIFFAFLVGEEKIQLLKDWSIVGSFAGALMFTMLIFSKIMTDRAKGPGEWHRYSVLQCLQRYPAIAAWTQDYRDEIRRADPRAEFEIAVLEQGGKSYGAALLQVVPRVIWHDQQEGKPLKVFNAMGIAIRFGEAYAPASA